MKIAASAGIAHGPPNTKDSAMDIELINALGAQLTDLSQRTADLRRYL